MNYIFNNLNTFSGGLTSNTSAQVVISNSSATLGSGTITLNSSVFRVTNGMTGGYTTPNALVLNGTNTFGNVINTGGNNLQFTGTTTLGGNGIAGISLNGTSASNHVATFSGVIGDGGANMGLTILGTGVLTLSGSQANTYTGTTLLNSAAATLYLNKNSGVAAVSGSALTLTSGTVKFGQSNQLTGTAQVTVNGGVFDLAGNNQQFGPLVGNGGLVTSSSGTATLTLGESSSTSYSGTIAGAGLSLVKNGTGTLTLSGSNSYAGTTSISSGGMEFQNQNSLYGNNTASWTAANLNVASGAMATFGVGGTNQFTSANLDTLLALGTGSNGFQAGSNIGLDVTSGTTFTYASNLANPNSGANTLGLVKSGAGTLVLSGSNSYSGGTTLGSGTLNYTNLNALGSGALTFSGSATLLAGVSGTLAKNIVINPGATALFDMTSADITLTGTISGSGAFSKSGNALNGNLNLYSINSYTGGTIINGQGNLNLYVSGALGNNTLTFAGNAGRLNLDGYSQTITGLIIGGGGAIIQNGTATGSGTGVLTVALASGTNSLNANSYFRDSSGGTGALGLVKTGAGTLDFSLYNTMSYSGGLAVNGGALAFNNVAALGTGSLTLGGGTLAVTSGSSVTIAKNATLTASTISGIDTGSGTVTYSGTLSGAGSIAKSGVGTLTLNHTNTYNGSTAVHGGTLVVSGSLSATSSVSIDSGAMLSVDGKVNSAITSAGTVQGQGNVNALDISANGTLAPGMSTANSNNGTLTAAGNVVFVGGSNAQLSIRLGQTTALGTDTLALASGAYSVNLNGADLSLTLGGSFGTPPLNSVYVIIDGNSSSLSQGLVISGTFAQGSSITVGGDTFSILYNENSTGAGAGKDVILQLTSVPEPSAWAIMMLGGLGMLLFARVCPSFWSSEHHRVKSLVSPKKHCKID